MGAPARASTSASRLATWLFSAESAVSLAVFRILWGALMAWESWRYLANGWIHRYYVEPTFLFKYPGFGWVERLEAPGMLVVAVAMVVSGALVSVGLAYRAGSAVFFLSHTYTFLLGASNYLNHGYLICLLAGLMILAPAHRTLSVDAILRPRIAAAVVPAWSRALLRVQLGIVYVYGGIAKLNADWMIHHQPVRRWMQGSADRVPAPLHDLVASEGFTVFVAIGGVAFDLLIVPALLWKRTRPLAALASVGFHLCNMQLFSIGVFPWLMLAATTLFFEPDWPLRVPGLGRHIRRAVGWITGRAEGVAETVRWAGVWSKLWVAWVAVQLLVPLRHVLHRGDVAWTEAGHYFAWRMKLRSKRGSVHYRLVDTVSGETWTVDPADELSKRQVRKMAGKPELIRQYANHLVRRYREQEGRVVEVYVEAFASLNYRASQRFIDPEQEIGHAPASWGSYDWVLPMQWSEPPHPGAAR